DLKFYGLGGENLREAGIDLLFDLEHQGLFGFLEIVSSLKSTLQIYRSLKASLASDPPSAVVLIDYPDFNLRLARAAKRLGIPVFYYISPQLWAWRQGRVKKIDRYVDSMAVVFPFEPNFYQQHGIEVSFVGHPLLDIMKPPRPKEEVKAELGFDPARPLLGLLPGSRVSEIKAHLPLMLEAAGRLSAGRPNGISMAVAQADSLGFGELAPFLEQGPGDVELVVGRTHELQNAADVILTASGTATLETALMLTPMVVIYRLKSLSYHIFRRLVKIDHVAMANLIAGEEVVPELLQNEAHPDNIVAELNRILDNPEDRRRMVEGLMRVRDRLGGPGASLRAARQLLETIHSKMDA
ncbi:MAG: lipid-A-disaccharide synthase, partial [Deltaproteobacteria bacterium]|nr:lipid-A-disaccharide synthase [Deltaproteobacteria bacterium]